MMKMKISGMFWWIVQYSRTYVFMQISQASKSSKDLFAGLKSKRPLFSIAVFSDKICIVSALIHLGGRASLSYAIT